MIMQPGLTQDMRKTKSSNVGIHSLTRGFEKAKLSIPLQSSRYVDYTGSIVDSYASSASSPLLQTHTCLGSVDDSAEPVRHQRKLVSTDKTGWLAQYPHTY